MATNRKPKTKKIVSAKSKIQLPKIKLNANAKKVFADIQKDVSKRILANAQIDSKRNYASKKAQYFWNCISLAMTKKAIPAELKIPTKTNAKNRRDWCAKNNAVMVDASLVVETKDKKDARVDNAIRIRISRLSIQNKIGYVRAISNYDYLNNTNPKLKNMVYIYKK
jgi:hypothetical protein